MSNEYAGLSIGAADFIKALKLRALERPPRLLEGPQAPVIGLPKPTGPPKAALPLPSKAAKHTPPSSKKADTPPPPSSKQGTLW